MQLLSCPVLSSWREVGYPLRAEEQPRLSKSLAERRLMHNYRFRLEH